MFGRFPMLPRMAVRGIVATAYLPAGAAEPQVNPLRSHLDAFRAHCADLVVLRRTRNFHRVLVSASHGKLSGKLCPVQIRDMLRHWCKIDRSEDAGSRRYDRRKNRMLVFDPKDVFYLIAGAAFFGLTVLPMMCGLRLVSIPTMYVAAGMVLGTVTTGLPFIDPMSGEAIRLLVEHLTELIVIVALAGAGLAVDRIAGRAEWQHTWLLLIVVMPVTVALVAWTGMAFAGLSLAGAVLLGASLAPTDPVLARSVQVDGPNEGIEDDVRLSLTTEAGLNDGLAFPAVWLAIVLAGLSVLPLDGSVAQIL